MLKSYSTMLDLVTQCCINTVFADTPDTKPVFTLIYKICSS